jgi:hypothetical protein
MAAPELPDFYADGMQIAAGPYGLTLTFYVSDPDAGQTKVIGDPVARVRISVPLGEAMADLLKTAVAEHAKKTAAGPRG